MPWAKQGCLRGPAGERGADGVTPVITLEEVSGGVMVEVLPNEGGQPSQAAFVADGEKGDTGPQGPQGDPGPAASAAEVFAAAHPVGTYIETDGAAPTQGGSWQAVARPGVNAYRRTE